MKVLGFEWQGRKVLVTGASGFKGGWLCAALLQLGARVSGTVSNHRSPLSAFEVFGLDGRVNKLSVDISDRQQVYDQLNKAEPDVIFHLAAKALVPDGLRDPRRTFDVNIMGTLNIIEACRKLKVCNRLLICSTDHVFGHVKPEDLPPGGFVERARVSYGGPYDTSKAAMELMVRCYHYTYWSELPAIGITRCANVFGFGDTNHRRVIPFFIRSALNERVIPLKYRKNGRQFIHVTDAITGYLRAASSLGEGGTHEKTGRPRPEDDRSPFTPTFHFTIEQYTGTAEPYITMEGLAQQVASLHSARVDDSNCTDWAPNENKLQALNCQATREALWWKAKKSLPEALTDLGLWYQAEEDRASLNQLLDKDLAEVIAGVA